MIADLEFYMLPRKMGFFLDAPYKYLVPDQILEECELRDVIHSFTSPSHTFSFGQVHILARDRNFPWTSLYPSILEFDFLVLTNNQQTNRIRGENQISMNVFYSATTHRSPRIKDKVSEV